MGVSERKAKHKVDLKKDILSAAQELFMTKGYEATSIRNIAEMIEYSPATIYLYYKDKNEIIHALHQEGFKLLVSYFQVLNTVSDPFERLKAMGRAYIQFAIQNQSIYQLLFVMKEPMEHVESCVNQEWDEGERAFDILMHTVTECQAKGYFKGLDKEPLSFVIWSTMHGLCTLRISGHLSLVVAKKQIEGDLDTLMTTTYETFILMLERLKK